MLGIFIVKRVAKYHYNFFGFCDFADQHIFKDENRRF